MGTDALPYAKSFRELIVYQKQRQLAREVFKAAKAFLPEERYSLTDQLRRAARSICGLPHHHPIRRTHH